jgi:ribosomal protein S18 acetylase RimI-like enzyme
VSSLSPSPPTTMPSVEIPGRCGVDIEIRHLARGDVDVMTRLFDGLSARDRYLRFLAPMPRFPRRWMRALADSDGVRNVVLIAFQDDRPIGEGRFHRLTLESDAADMAVAVVSDQQQRGVGRALVAALAVEADRRGLRRFTVDVSPENAVVLSLLRRWGARLRLTDRLVSGDVEVQAILAAECLETTSLNGAPTVVTPPARTLTIPPSVSGTPTSAAGVGRQRWRARLTATSARQISKALRHIRCPDGAIAAPNGPRVGHGARMPVPADR